MITAQFQKLIWEYYKKNKREFPWRETSDPYKILVSEIMLQQTQTFRVLPKYESFIAQFPTINDLAKSNLSTVLSLWSGLGYNRRARFLYEGAKYISNNLKGIFPQEEKELRKIPGIGSYTASAILVFSYNLPLVFIETNIRRVFIHHFFKDKENINDKEIFPLIKKTLDKKNPREWYYALMDYGSSIPKITTNPNRKSKHYTKQSKFEDSIRKVRGEIIKQLLKNPKLTKAQLTLLCNTDSEKLEKALTGLEKDTMIKITKNDIQLV